VLLSSVVWCRRFCFFVAIVTSAALEDIRDVRSFSLDTDGQVMDNNNYGWHPLHGKQFPMLRIEGRGIEIVQIPLCQRA
jgi:hypothetical protein